MGDISIMIRNPGTNSVVEAELPDDAQMRELLPILVEKLGVENAYSFKLNNLTQKFQYEDTETLSDRKTCPNDLCVLSYEKISFENTFDIPENQITPGMVHLILRNAATGSRVQVELPNDKLIRELYPTMSDVLGMNDENYYLRLKNDTRMFEYADTDTFISRETKHGDTCTLSYEVIQGGPPPTGLDNSSISEVPYEEIVKDKGAIRMLLHQLNHYRTLCDSQEKKINQFEQKLVTGKVAALLFIIGQIVTGFGINLITQDLKGGWVVFAAGCTIVAGGIFFSLWPKIKRNEITQRGKEE